MTTKEVSPTKEGSRQWCYVDGQGRRIGYIWPEDFKAIIDSVWGWTHGVTGFANWSGMQDAHIRTYVNGKTPIPKHIALLVEMLQLYVTKHGVENLYDIKPEWLGQSFPPLYSVKTQPF